MAPIPTKGTTMAMEHQCESSGTFRVTFPGPFEHHDVIVDGWRVPFLQAHMTADDRVALVIDRRLASPDFTLDEAERVVPFIADAIAVALGYGAHPNEGTPRIPPRAPYPRPEPVVGLSELPPD